MIDEDLVIEDLLVDECSLEKALIVASGIRDEKEVSEYLRKLDIIQQGYYDKIARDGSNREKAQWLFDYMWGMTRELDDESSLVTDAIDSKLDLDRDIVCGDCVALTSLYSILGLRVGIQDLSVGVTPGHIFSFIESEKLVMENVNPKGFNYIRSVFQKGGLKWLISRTYNNRAADIDGADNELTLKYLGYSLAIDPICSESLVMRSSLFSDLSDFDRARQDIELALELYPFHIKVHEAKKYIEEKWAQRDLNPRPPG